MAGSLPSALARLFERVRSWLVRLGLLRGRWRHGRTTLETARFVPGLRTHRSRHYGLYIPAGLRDDERAPLIVVLHGCRQRALRFAEASGWVAHADPARVRLLCPDQRRWSNLYRCWNWFDPRAQRGQGEVQLVASMIDEVEQSVNVDVRSIAAVGISAGGALAALLAFHHRDRFRAVATVSAPPLLIGDFSLQSPKLVMQHGLMRDPALALGATTKACAPLLIIHGREDTIVNPRCAEQLLAQAAESYRRAGIETERLEHAEASGLENFTEYRAGGALVLRRIEITRLGHVWTGGPGGHPFCERGGPDLTAMCAQFLREVGFGEIRAAAEPVP